MCNNHKNNITFICVVPNENCKTQNTHHPTFSILGWETCPLVSNINSRSTPSVLRHLNRRCSALSSAFLCVKITLCQTVHHRLLNRTATMCFFSLHPHSITPHLLPFFLLIKERSYSSEKGMASPEPWTWTSLSFDFSLPLSFSIWLCHALYSLQSGAKY